MIDIAIVGLPRSGTTALYSYLASHPAIAGAAGKETYFLMDADKDPQCDRPRFVTHGWAGLAPAFADAKPGQLRLEATTWHIYQETARTALAALDPQPLVIVCLREPAEQIRSMFYYAQFHNRGTGLTFETFVSHLLNERYSELERVMEPRDARNFLTRNDYCSWLDVWSADFPPERLMIVPFDDLVSRAGEICEEICKRVGVDSAHFAGLVPERVNPTVHWRSDRFHRMVVLTAIKLTRPLGLRGLKSWLFARYITVMTSNTNARSREIRDAGALAELREAFRGPNARLAQRYGIRFDDDRSRLQLSGGAALFVDHATDAATCLPWPI